MIAIDVHMCIRPDEDAERLAAALAGLNGQGVQLHQIHGAAPLPCKIVRGFGQGRAEWCSWVDADDLVLPGAFAAVRAEIEANPGSGVYFTRERWFGVPVNLPGRQCQPYAADAEISLGHILQNPLAAHHLCVIRRPLLDHVLSLLRPVPEIATAWAIVAVACALGGFRQVPFEGYAWRIHPGNTCMQWTDRDLLSTQARIFNAVIAGRRALNG